MRLTDILCRSIAGSSSTPSATTSTTWPKEPEKPKTPRLRRRSSKARAGIPTQVGSFIFSRRFSARWPLLTWVLHQMSSQLDHYLQESLDGFPRKSRTRTSRSCFPSPMISSSCPHLWYVNNRTNYSCCFVILICAYTQLGGIRFEEQA